MVEVYSGSAIVGFAFLPIGSTLIFMIFLYKYYRFIKRSNSQGNIKNRVRKSELKLKLVDVFEN